MTPARRAGLRVVLEQLRRPHLVVEGDCWFSCPKSGECCNDSRADAPCDCGADATNTLIAAALALVEEEE